MSEDCEYSDACEFMGMRQMLYDSVRGHLQQHVPNVPVEVLMDPKAQEKALMEAVHEATEIILSRLPENCPARLIGTEATLRELQEEGPLLEGLRLKVDR